MYHCSVSVELIVYIVAGVVRGCALGGALGWGGRVRVMRMTECFDEGNQGAAPAVTHMLA
jgi:hypothetical protein